MVYCVSYLIKKSQLECTWKVKNNNKVSRYKFYLYLNKGIYIYLGFDQRQDEYQTIEETIQPGIQF